MLVVTNWIQSNRQLQDIDIGPADDHLKDIFQLFKVIYFILFFGELNQEVDQLSKEAQFFPTDLYLLR